MAELYYEPIGPNKIEEVGDLAYDQNGNIFLNNINVVNGWDLVKQEIRIMMISDEDTIGSEAELAIDIRQYADGAADLETAELIQDWIETKLNANPLLSPLDIVVEIVPLDYDQFEIIFKRPNTSDDIGSTYVDLDFKVGIDVNRGVVTGLLDNISTAGDLYTANPILVTEYRNIQQETNILFVNYVPVDTEPILLYNKEDVSVSDGVINTQAQDVDIPIDLQPRRTYSIIDFSSMNLERAVIEDYSLIDSESNTVDTSQYALIGTNLIIPTNSEINGSYTLQLTVSERYANVRSRDRLEADKNVQFIYPFLRTAEYKIVFDKSLKKGMYFLQYYVYGDRT